MTNNPGRGDCDKQAGVKKRIPLSLSVAKAPGTVRSSPVRPVH